MSKKFYDTILEAEFTVASLSAASGVARNTISKMVRGQEVQPLAAYKICRVLGEKLGRRITPEDLGLVLRLPKI